MNNMIIQADNINFIYKNSNIQITALNNISFKIKKGEFIAIIGANGSGKTSLGKLFNALFVPSTGKMRIGEMDTSLPSNLQAIRQKVGMVFQNPENQIIGSTVEEDIAFGLENLGLELTQMEKRIEASLKVVHMEHLKKISPHDLSGGQKQRLAIASVIAMQSEIIVFDEPTTLLDPESAKEILNLIHTLNKMLNITIIFITQNMNELLNIDRILVLDKGKLLMDNTPDLVFSISNAELLHSLGLELPAIAEISEHLIKLGVIMPRLLNREDEMIEFITSYKKK